ncbi:MAG: SPFH domain-containing protein [Planctomycetota bacterium]|nr:SPFH domain-containing protein [Planctomycetota bacterium]MDA1179806.1 SPFH domain-containing protein [Planctomycetota bacterium]
MVKEKQLRAISGWGPLVMVTAFGMAAVALLWSTVALADTGTLRGPGMAVGLCGTVVFAGLALTMLFGFQAVAPNDARVMLLFGDYKGSIARSGFYWVNPFYSKKRISLRMRIFETGSTTTPETKDATGKVLHAKTRSAGRPSKVNDRDGNPIDITAVVVWRVVNTAEVLFEVDDYEDFVAVQSEAALRSLAAQHPYDSDDHEVSLRGNTADICDQLRLEIQARLEKAGIEVIEARICHLAYAPEIAAAMLQRQQAQAVVAARTKIVEGAVGMVQMALEHLSRDKIVELDGPQRAAMVANLLVVLCSDRHTQPVVNTGTSHD